MKNWIRSAATALVLVLGACSSSRSAQRTDPNAGYGEESITPGGTSTGAEGSSSGGSLALEPGVDRPGSDYKDFDLDAADPALCQAACAGEAGCKAFTYVKPGVQGDNARCWLKGQVPAPEKNDCCVSGKR